MSTFFVFLLFGETVFCRRDRSKKTIVLLHDQKGLRINPPVAPADEDGLRRWMMPGMAPELLADNVDGGGFRAMIGSGSNEDRVQATCVRDPWESILLTSGSLS